MVPSGRKHAMIPKSSPSPSIPTAIPPAKAFTLVELMIVVGLISVLIALLFPSLSALRSRADAVKCMSNIRQLGLALRFYACDNRDSYPMNISAPNSIHWSDAATLRAYLKVPNAPMDGSSALWCPNDDGAQQSYAMNVWASSAADKSITSLTTGQLWPHRRPATSLILLAESWSYIGSATAGFLPSTVIGGYGSTAATRFGALGGIGPIYAGRWGPVNSELTYARHRLKDSPSGNTQPVGRTCICFDDGHVSLCADTDLFNSVTGQSTGMAAWSLLDFAK